MNELEWYWPASKRGTAGGKEGAGLDEFANDYIGNLAREIIQNSIDAKNGNETVSVEFSTFKTKCNDFPGLEDFFFNYVKAWIDEDSKSEISEEKERKFMERISQCIISSQKNGIIWLRISDKGTTGLRGVSDPWNKRKPWFAFINGSGKDVKNEGSGGSKGLGKNAIFINSAIRTIFVSTKTIDSEEGNIGYSKLISKTIKEDENGQPDWTQGVGYCVTKEAKQQTLNTPSGGLLNLDPNYQRQNLGTDIFVPFFFCEESWARRLISEAIISFMPALIEGDLIVSVNDNEHNEFYDVNSNNLYSKITDPAYFEKDSTRSLSEELYRTISYPTASNIYASGTDNEMKIYISTNSSNALNKVYTYRWQAKMRIEMFSTDSTLPYTAVIYIKGKALCDKLKSIEDATHKSWNVSKWKDSDYDKETLKEARESVRNFAKIELQKIEDSDFGGISDFEWATDEGWNADSGSSTLEATKNEEEGLPVEEISFEKTKKQKKNEKKPRKPRATEFNNDGEASGFKEGRAIENEEGGDVGSHPDGENGGGGNDPHPGPNELSVVVDDNGKKMMIRKPVSTISSRMPVKNLNEGLFKLVFIPSKSGDEAEIEILKSGTGNDNERVEIVSALIGSKVLIIKDNMICLDKIEANQKYEIVVKLNTKKIYTWEVNINANE